MRIKFLILLLFLPSAGSLFAQSKNLSTENGTITFRSEAALELIKATSNELSGKIDESKHTFAFRVLLRSFEGFNSEIGRAHV